jgi:hypothetical protein
MVHACQECGLTTTHKVEGTGTGTFDPNPHPKYGPLWMCLACILFTLTQIKGDESMTITQPEE